MKHLSSYPFEYKFLEDSFDNMYREDARVGETFTFFTILALAIAASGLFGLAAFAAGKRTREIGIRKVLGASVQSIVILISKDFLKLVLLAFVLSIPLAWYGMQRWLESFAYRIDIEWWMLAGSGLLVIVVAYVAVGYQSLKASMSDPVKSLKAE
jgi:putative ABC transport system permease protein